MQIDPQRLLVLHAVAESGGVLAAAQRLHLAPSGVSQHLAALERETGVALIDRSQRGGQRPIRLTSAGRRLADQAARLRILLDNIEADLVGRAGGLSGTVTVAVFPTLIAPLALPALDRLRHVHPALRPRIVELEEQPALAALRRGELDVILVERHDSVRRTSVPGISQRWLLDDPYRLVVPPSQPTPAALADLDSMGWIDGPEPSAAADALSTLRTTTGLSLRPAYQCLEYPAVLTLVAAGLGAALVPQLALTPTPPATVRVIDLSGLGHRSIHASYLTNDSQRASVAAMLDALTQAANAAHE